MVTSAMTLPTFIIAGAPKCGTTALWRFLDEHPCVGMSQIKEPRFFTSARSFGEGIIRPGPPRPIQYDRGLAWYESLFDPAKAVRGEASTLYFGASDAAELIRRHLPDVRLVFLLRDPAARLYSHYWQDHKSGIELESFDRMVANETPEFRFYALFSGYRRNLERFLATFPEEQLLFLLYDDLRRNPLETFRAVCRFIGADPAFTPTTFTQAHNPHAVPRSRHLAALSTRLQHAKATQWLPEGMRRALGRVRGKLSELNARPAAYPPMPAALRAQLVERFADDVAYVERLLDVDLAAWCDPDWATAR